MFCLEEIRKINISEPNKDEVNHYLLADCGGGTVDIVAHKLTKKPNGEIFIEEIHKVHGGAYGGFAVNEEFERMLQKMFQLTTEELELIKRKYAQKWTKLAVTDFENAKYAVDPNNTHTPCTITLSPDLCSGIKNLKHKTVAQLVEEYKKHTVEWDEDDNELLIPYSTMRSLFIPIIAKIGTVIEDLLQKPECKPINEFCLLEALQKVTFYLRNLKRGSVLSE